MGILVRGAKAAEGHATTVAAIVGGLLLAVPPIYDEELGEGWAAALVVLGVIIGAAGVIVAAIQRKRLRGELTAAQNSLAEAREEGVATQTLLFDKLLPRTMERLIELEAAPMADRPALHTILVTHVIGAISGYYSEGDDLVRVNYYRLDSDESGAPCLRIFDRTEYASRQVLDESTPEGSLILNRVLGGDDVYCEDLRSEEAQDLHVREASRDHKYLCFASVVVRANRDAYGMLSANSPRQAGLPQSSVAFLSVFGGILALAEAMTGVTRPVEVAERDVLG